MKTDSYLLAKPVPEEYLIGRLNGNIDLSKRKVFSNKEGEIFVSYHTPTKWLYLTLKLRGEAPVIALSISGDEEKDTKELASKIRNIEGVVLMEVESVGVTR